MAQKETKKKELAAAELSAFAGQLALIIDAGLSVSEGIDIMAKDAENPEEKEILRGIQENLEIGETFYDALDEAGVFPQYMVRMVETGQRTGNLDKVMHTLENHYDREDGVRRSIYQAVVYPVILSVMVIAVILVLLILVMPVFDRIFQALGTTMSGIPLILTEIGRGISGIGLWLFAIVLVIAIVLLVMGKTDQGENRAMRLRRLIPGMKKISHAEAACRFAGHMSLVLSSGLTAEEGVDMALAMNENPEFAAQLQACKQQMEEGDSFAQALSEQKLFSGIYAQLVSTGARTGMLEEALERIADLYQDEIDDVLMKRLSRLEPALIILLSVIVGGILLSVMIPLLHIMTAL